ncbi:MAG: hypothetical protein ACR2MB_06935 [Acidimicrobiales bacterium]
MCPRTGVCSSTSPWPSTSGCAVVVVEQHVALALEIADRAYLLGRGRVTTSGTAAELAADRSLLEAGYFGDPAV